WRNLIEETLRFAPPVANLLLRFAVNDIDVAGQRISAGDPIVVGLAAANRNDDLHGSTAATFDPGRPIREHLAFGFGRHYCLGDSLARLLAQVALPALFAQFPHVALAPKGTMPSLNSIVLHGYQRLPVRLGAPTG